jgi:hypothetical protein
MAKKPIYGAGRLLQLIAERHTKDVFVPECKDGPSWGRNTPRMDAWAMNRSWANFCCTGYEIKVSRADWLQDTKWPQYLELCHRMYLVAPQDVIRPDELPESMGLLVPTKNSTKLYTKKKAPFRELEIPWSMLAYVLMCRATIAPEPTMYRKDVPNAEYWRTWLADKSENKTMGHRVSRALSTMFRERVDHVECDNKWLKAENEKLEDVKAAIKSLGVNLHGWNPADEARRKIENLRKQIPDGLLNQVTNLARDLDRLAAKFQAQGADNLPER